MQSLSGNCSLLGVSQGSATTPSAGWAVAACKLEGVMVRSVSSLGPHAGGGPLGQEEGHGEGRFMRT